MKSISYNKITGLNAVKGLGHDISSIAAWSAVATYALGETASSGSRYYASRRPSNTNHAVTDADWWVEIDTITAIPLTAIYAKLEAETQAVRYIEDGHAVPTTGATGNGMILSRSDNGVNNAVIVGPGGNALSNIKMIEAAASAGVNVTFYSN